MIINKVHIIIRLWLIVKLNGRIVDLCYFIYLANTRAMVIVRLAYWDASMRSSEVYYLWCVLGSTFSTLNMFMHQLILLYALLDIYVLIYIIYTLFSEMFCVSYFISYFTSQSSITFTFFTQQKHACILVIYLFNLHSDIPCLIDVQNSLCFPKPTVTLKIFYCILFN